jgi:hypothetical protein
MRADQSAAPQAAGFFERLAEPQLVPAAVTAPGSLRPWLPYSFDQPMPADDEPARAHDAGAMKDLAMWSAGTLPLASGELTAAPRDEAAGARVLERPFKPALTRAAAVADRSTARAGGADVQLPSDRESRAPVASAPIAATRTARVLSPSETAQRRPGHVESPAERLPVARHGIHVESSVNHGRGSQPPGLAPPVGQAPQLVPAPRLTPRRSAPTTASSDLQRRAVSEPTIEIHIGRVEVRAHTAAAERPAAQRPSPSDERLAAYLRRRGTGARS